MQNENLYLGAPKAAVAEPQADCTFIILLRIPFVNPAWMNFSLHILI